MEVSLLLPRVLHNKKDERANKYFARRVDNTSFSRTVRQQQEKNANDGTV
jgi:hypothetical protein